MVLQFHVKEGLPFAWDLDLENSSDSYLCFQLGLLHSVSYLFFLYQSPSLSDELNCFCGMVDQQKVFGLISSWDYCQRSSPSRISNMPRAGFEPAQNLSSGLVEWSCAVVITTTPRCHNHCFGTFDDQWTGNFFSLRLTSVVITSLL